MRHFLSIKDLSQKEIVYLLEKAKEVKHNPRAYSHSLNHRTLLMFFEKVSVRTRLSFEMGMAQLGGYASYYNMQESTIGKKESIEDFARVVSRYTNGIMARISSQEDLEKIARNSRVPVISGMTDFEHPCQILSDLFTIYEKKGEMNSLKLAYVGDGYNNVTHSLLLGCALMGIDISVACPKQFMPDKDVSIDAIKLAKDAKSVVEIGNNPMTAVVDADVVYTDSWMSYHIPHSQEKSRTKIFKPFQVNSSLMSVAKKDAIFMHCLPAKRDAEVTSEVLDSGASVIVDQAENRMHAQKALLLWLMKENKD